MGDKPLIFSGPMVRALLEGRKTQTRRNASKWIREYSHQVTGEPMFEVSSSAGGCIGEGDPSDAARYHMPWQPGDRIWVRETWGSKQADHTACANQDGYRKPLSGDDILYSADPASDVQWSRGHSLGGFCWRSSIHMPRWASRLTLVVTDVRVQRLQEIREEDAKAEGARPAFTRTTIPDWPVSSQPSYLWGFEELWSSINGPGSWDANPWVCALTFTVHRCNIDAMEAGQ